MSGMKPKDAIALIEYLEERKLTPEEKAWIMGEEE